MKVKHLKALLDLQDPESEIGSTNQEGVFIPELEITNGFVNQWSKDNGYYQHWFTEKFNNQHVPVVIINWTNFKIISTGTAVNWGVGR
jgi:hypothetical protein